MNLIHLKTNRVLHIICIAFLIIGIRVLHLGVIQREDQLKEAEKPKLRTLLLRADRGEICDRFHIPMATNRICYNAAIDYCQINQLPSKGWAVDEQGHRIRTYPRREHIKQLSRLLGEVLQLEAGKIEDLIHSKASLLPHVPFVLKTNLEEKEYYRLKMLEKDYPGIHAEIGSERYYPQGKTGCHLLGTLGSISPKQYAETAQEIKALQEIVTECETFGPPDLLSLGYTSMEEVVQRLETLKDKAYGLNDKVGKSGIEKMFEEDLRGAWGIKILEVDNQGKPIRELPKGKTPSTGKKIVLSISSELQQFAEELLIQSEKDRDGKSLGIDPSDKTRKTQKQPWIKGGAIVALDPKNGEILALASHPRFDPNDFIGSANQNKTLRWLESEQTIGAIWDGKEVMARERFQGFLKKLTDEKVLLSWEFYLDQILPKEGSLRTFFEKVDDIKGAVQIQEDFQALLYFSPGASPSMVMEALTAKTSSLWDKLRSSEDASIYLRRLESFLRGIEPPEDRLFAIDLCRLSVHSPRFGDDLLAKIGAMKISTYRSLNQAFCRLLKKQKEEAFKEFHESSFASWRSTHQKEFLSQKRAIEKEKKTYAKPYIDYLDQKEQELFQTYWLEERIPLLLKSLNDNDSDADKEALQKIIATLPLNLREEFLRTFRSFHDLDQPLLTKHRKLKTEKDLASAFYPKENFGYSRSYAFQTNVPQGSLFKLVTAYEGLRQGHNFSLLDEQRYDTNAPHGKKLIVAYGMDNTPYPRLYKGGRLPKSLSPQIGVIDMVGALERSSNPYFSILAGDLLQSSEDLNTAAALFGYGTKTGVHLPGEKRGNLPKDLSTNRTGLYSYAMGQHTLLSTPLQSALMCATLANGGHLLKPQIIKNILDTTEGKEIFTAEKEEKHSIYLPLSIRNTIFEGIDKCTWSNKGSARPSSIRSLLANPLLMHSYLTLQHQMIGKTGTAEILFNPGCYPSSPAQIYNHVWFGAISFQGEATTPSKILWEHPDLVVVVFLPFASGGKEGAPLAAQMILKWKEICKQRNYTDRQN